MSKAMLSNDILKKLIKFGVTGGLGTITNLILFFFLADILNINANIASIICFLIACTQNYIINHIWTFKLENSNTKPSVKLWIKFLIASLTGLAVNITVLNILMHIHDWKYRVIPQAIGILAGMVLNFAFSNLFVFGKKGEK